jgi:hypothetical protein
MKQAALCMWTSTWCYGVQLLFGELKKQFSVLMQQIFEDLRRFDKMRVDKALPWMGDGR